MAKTEGELARQKRQNERRRARARVKKREARAEERQVKERAKNATGAMVIPPHIAALSAQLEEQNR